MEPKDWYICHEVDQIDSPALLVYQDRIKSNIQTLLQKINTPERLRPHVKTFKCVEVVKLMLDAGISQFKCATIAEAEMLAVAGVKDVLLAYPLLAPKTERYIKLIRAFPEVKFSALVDDEQALKKLNAAFDSKGLIFDGYVDLNIGTNRTGVLPDEKTLRLFDQAQNLQAIHLKGLHIYDGHIRDKNLQMRKAACDTAYSEVEGILKKIEKKGFQQLEIIAGGTPTFPIHAKRPGVICSPGTFPYWDKGYADALPEQKFLFAAVLLTRVVSRPAKDLICVDLGYKAVASESPLDKRAYFFKNPELKAVSHSEEHLVLKVKNGEDFPVGTVLYAIPFHVCPTVALYEEVQVIVENHQIGTWKNLGRDRKINF
ncbi:D-TA family PLP-dependent enzyme [Pararhodonellum marinum]|uniref:D-TA family PLP-dependent enzyme n=1 Tax=Pararhodonellum marinum TaxID=2755358 RepID=UPI001890133F|nr:D-TA family PLP-dependent enzyme [Pararhodonellum marinum]